MLTQSTVSQVLSGVRWDLLIGVSGSLFVLVFSGVYVGPVQRSFTESVCLTHQHRSVGLIISLFLNYLSSWLKQVL